MKLLLSLVLGLSIAGSIAADNLFADNLLKIAKTTAPPQAFFARGFTLGALYYPLFADMPIYKLIKVVGWRVMTNSIAPTDPAAQRAYNRGNNVGTLTGFAIYLYQP